MRNQLVSLVAVCFVSARCIFSLDIKIGLLLPVGDRYIFYTPRLLPAADIALETVNNMVQEGKYLNFSLISIYRATGPICSPTNMISAGLSSDLFYHNDTVAIIGPPCSFAAKAVGDLGAYWNIPVISMTATSADLAAKTQYKTLTRTSMTMSTLGAFVSRVFQKYGWKRCSLVWIDFDGTSTWRVIANAIRANLEKDEEFYVYNVHIPDFETVEDALEEAARNGRIIIISVRGEIMRQMMVYAYHSGYINGQYAFFSVDLFGNSWHSGEDSWYQGGLTDFSGTWKLESSSPNYEDLLKAMEFGFLLRKALINLRPQVTIKQDGDDFIFTVKSVMISRETKFKIGVAYIEKHPFKDEENEILVTWDGETMIQRALNNEIYPVITRSLDADGRMVLKQKLGDIEVIQVYTKV